MPDLELILGNKNFSSWSLRAWLALRRTKAPFRETQIWMDEDIDYRQRLRYSPTGAVPVLRDGELVVWDSLAIGEYLAERFPEAGLWPREIRARTRARSLCCEMHAGFHALREHLPMNLRARKAHRDRGEAAREDVERVIELWTDARREFGAGGPFLFGAFTLADCFYAPVATRLRTYGVPLEGEARAYCEALLAWPDFRAWEAAAESEAHTMEPYASAP